MREIKFRQFIFGISIKTTGKSVRGGKGYLVPEIITNKSNKGQWHYWGFIEGGFISPQNNKDESQQFTGLKDKNGVEIYEGDIVTQHKLRTEHLGELNHEIIFYPDYCGFAVATLSEDGKERFISHLEKGIELEVIGNIYENPELLKSS